MSQSKSFAQQINGFVGGLITEATELTFPPNASVDELNCVLRTKGNRQRRLGIDFQNNFVLSPDFITDAQLETFAINTFSWRGVGEEGDRNFFVVQLGNIIRFYAYGITPLSNGLKSFTINLNSYLATGQTDMSDTIASFAVGRGDLFIVSGKTEPIRVSYVVASDTIAITPIAIRIRDFEGINDGYTVEERRPTLDAAHHYNLLNQGWSPTQAGYNPIIGPFSSYFGSSGGLYPPNNLQWFLAKNISGVISPATLLGLVLGTSEAPKGHFILNPFYKDRSTASGIPGFAVVSTNTRPVTVGFFAGRVVYAINGDIYLSQVLNRSRDNAGKCYQDADPASEAISDLVATDGILITIPNANSIQFVMEVGSALVIFAKNGVWTISGTDGGFKATDFSVKKVTSTGVLSSRAVVDVEGAPIWLSETGIETLTQDASTGQLSAVSLTETTIKTFYSDIISDSANTLALSNSIGAYDKATGRVMWLYKDATAANAGVSPYYYNKILLFDIALKAFYPWSISSLTSHSPFISGVVITPTINLGDNIQSVAVASGDLVIVTNLDTVVTITDTRVGEPTFFQYLTIVPNTGDTNNKITFSEFTNNTFTDWQKYAIIVDVIATQGVNFDSFLETGWDIQQDVIRFKQAPYITVHCNRTEVGMIYSSTGVPIFTNPSGLLLRAKWDWTNGESSGKWSTPQRAYRLQKRYFPIVDDLTWDNGFGLTSTKLRIRGSGRALQLRFESEPGKDFDIVGWGTVLTGTTDS